MRDAPTAPGARRGLGGTGLARGDLVGRFLVIDELGRGGMGVVLSAYDPDLNRRVALKLLRPDAEEGDAAGEGKERLLREARAMAQVRHDNAVDVYDVGEVDGTVFIAMEFVEGETLRAWIGRERPWRETVRMFARAGRGLASAHRVGLVHRDFKPENVLVDEEGVPKVTDFGLVGGRPGEVSREPEPATGGEMTAPFEGSLTRTGAVLGTPAYMAPEQMRGLEVDERADQFAFCVALYEALYGERPFDGETLSELAMEVLSGRVRAAPEGARVPARLRDILLRGLAVEPEARFATMDALVAELERDPAARRRRIAGAGAAVAIAVFAAAAGAVAWRQSERADASAAQVTVERDRAEAEARRARDSLLVAAARRWGDPTMAAALLREVAEPGETPGWTQAAIDTLAEPVAESEASCGSPIFSASYSADGRRVILGCEGGTARVLETEDFETGRTDRAIELRHGHPVTYAALTPEGRRAVTFSALEGDSLRGWDLATPDAPRWEVQQPDHRVSSAPGAMSPRGDFLLMVSQRDPTVRLVALDGEGAPVALEPRRPDPAPPFPIPGPGAREAAFSRDGRRVVAVYYTGGARIWDLDRPDEPQVFRVPGAFLVSARFHPNGRWLVTPSRDGSIWLWDLTAPARPRRLPGRNEGAYERSAFSPDGRFLATVSSDETLHLWSFERPGAPSLVGRHRAGRGPPAFSPDGGRILTHGMGGVARLWEPAGSMELILRGHENVLSAAAFRPDGERILTASHDGTARSWAPGRLAPQVLRIGGGEPREVIGLSFGRDGGLLATGRRRVRIWDARGDGVASWEPGTLRRPLRLGPDGGRLIGVTADGRGLLIRVGEDPILFAASDDGHIHEAFLSPSGEQALVVVRRPGERSMRLEARNLDGAPAAAPAVELGEARQAWASPDGTRLLIASFDHVLRVQRTHEMAEETVLGRHREKVVSAGFSRDGDRAVTGATDRTARVWALDRTADPIILRAGGTVFSVGFSPDATHVVGVFAGKVGVWRVRDAGEPVILPVACAWPRAAAFAPDARRIAVGCDDGSVHLVPFHGLETGELGGALWRATTACLPAVERARLLGESRGRATRRADRCRERARDAAGRRRAGGSP